MSGVTPPLATATATAQERHAIHAPGGAAGMVDPDVAARLHALCLSGGGIRSAAFCLGVIQALARQRLLQEFHYLSTVSGGGYAGALVWRLIATLGSVTQAEAELATPGAAGFSWLRGIRDYTSYLAPAGGFTSLDVWAACVLYLRNTLFNFIVFAPGLIGIALLPRLYLRVSDPAAVWSFIPDVLLALALAGLLFATVLACLWVPVHVLPADRKNITTPRIVRNVTAPALLVWAFMIGAWAGCHSDPPSWLTFLTVGNLIPKVGVVPVAAGIVMLLGYVFAGIFAACATTRVFPRLYAAMRSPAEPRQFWGNRFGWLVACAVDVGALWLGAWLISDPPHCNAPLRPVIVAVLAPAWVVTAHLLHAAVYAVWRREMSVSWLDREWIARLSATQLLGAGGWALLSAVCLLLPHGLSMVSGEGFSNTKLAVTLSGLFSGPLAALLGRSATTVVSAPSTQATLRRVLPNVLAALASALFLAALLVLASAGGWRVIARPWNPPEWHHLQWWSQAPSFGRLLLAIFLLIGLSLLLGWRLNVNRFSLHELYRNRLARAFLGAACPTRSGDGFANLDEADRVALGAMATPHPPGRRLFPVINTALNLTSGTRTAWAERKAASFTMTPLHCGSAVLGEGDPAEGVFVATAEYGGVRFNPVAGIYLDTAITISGAAVSPNAGYHSSPTTAFIMTLFNARLGAWMPNPARASRAAMRRSKPPNSFWALIAEMLGRTDDKASSIYLSDGGHFENLGLYEMLRRRCALILVVDADCDPDYQYFDLGNAIRKARIDLDVEITFFPLEQPIAGAPPARRFLRAEISYPPVGYLAASTGILLYLKAHRLPDMPADVMAYAAANAAFPHESTGNQFFTESQFESYRRLGEHLAS
jgi:hypothetical protein